MALNFAPLHDRIWVLFGKYAGTDIILDGEDYLIIREDEVLGINLGAASGKRVSHGATARSA